MAVAIYIITALLSYSTVQSAIGSALGHWMSNEWGGVVKVGSVHIDPFNHVRLHNVLLVSPDNDTVFDAERIHCRFKGLPVADGGIKMRSAVISNTTFHLRSGDGTNNFKYIIDYFKQRNRKKEKELKDNSEPFVVDIKDVILHNVHYKMTLKPIPYYSNQTHSVDVANMDMDSINAHITNLRVVNDAVKCKIIKMSTTERSGWRMRKLAGNVDVSGKGIHVTDMQLQTDNMNMLSDVHLVFDSWRSLDWYCDSVYMDVTFKPGNVLSMMDAAYWAPTLWGCDNSVKIEGHVIGPVADLRVENFDIRFGNKSHIQLDGSVSGLPFVEGTFFDLHLHQLKTDIYDLLDIHHPGQLNVGNTQLYDELGTIDIAADLVGGAEKWFANMDLRSDLGDISWTANVKRNSINKNTSGTLNLHSKHIDFPSVIRNNYVTHTGLDVDIEANGSCIDDLKGSVQALLFNTSLLGNDIDKASLSGTVANRECNLSLDISDSVLAMAATGLISYPKNASNRYSVDIDIAQADLRRLHLIESSASCKLKTHLQADISTSPTVSPTKHTISPTGFLWINRTRLEKDGKLLDIDNVNLAVYETDSKKNISLESDIVNINANGYFEYSDIPILVKKFKHDYLPDYWLSQSSAKDISDDENLAISDANIALNLRWKDPSRQIHFFVPDLDIANGTTLTASYNFTESLKTVLRSDSICYGSLNLYAVGATSYSQGDKYCVKTDISEFSLNHKGMMNNLVVSESSGNDGGVLETRWDPHSDAFSTSGDIAIALHSDSSGNYLSIIKPYFTIDGNRWELSKRGDVRFNRERFHADRVELTNGGQSLLLSYQSNKDAADFAQAEFSDVDLNMLTSILTKDMGISAAGDINGSASVQWLPDNSSPLVKANLTIDSCLFNRHNLGDVNLRTNIDLDHHRMHLFVNTELNESHTISHPVQASGYLEFGNETSIDLTAGFEQFDLQSVEPLLKSFSSRFEGFLTGDLTLQGTLKNPNIQGKAWVRNGLLNIDATNVSYLFDDTIRLTNNHIHLNQFKVRDTYDNSALITGNINYNGFSDISLDLGVSTERLLLYNASASAGSAYGSVFASLNGKVKGPLSNLDITASAQTKRGSDLTVPITSQRSVTASDYIVFVSDDDYLDASEPKTDKKKLSVSSNINLNLSITPDLKLFMPIDMSNVSLDIKGQGNGSIQVSMAPKRDMQVVGSYNIESGSMKLGLLSVVSKEFKIEEGSSIEFPGSLNDASLDVNAIYSQRVELSSLRGYQENEIAQKPIPVESVVSLTGRFSSPNIAFDIRLPNADQSIQDEVFAYIDRSNERDMLNQTLYLLISGKFYNANASNNASGNTDLTGSGMAMVANTLGSVVSSMIDFVDINFDYSAATDTRSEQYSVGINKQWNKFYLESTLGYGGYDRDLSSDEALANNIVGDMLVGYKFNPRLHLFVFNRSNTNDYTRHELPYKQGFGLKYTRDFDKWKDLFRRKKKKTSR